MRMRASLLMLLTTGLGAALGTACSASVGTEPAPLGSSIPLTVGQEYLPYPQGALGVSLASVDSDSRCPASVQCVSAGSATITLGVRMGMGPTVPTTLTWGVPSQNSTVAGGLRITFDSLTPYPATPGPLLAQSKYRAWISARPTTSN